MKQEADPPAFHQILNAQRPRAARVRARAAALQAEADSPRRPRRTFHLDRRVASIIAAEVDGDDNDLLSTSQVAEWFGTSEQWLELGRCKGYGPPFIKLGPKRVRYRRCDVVAWLLSRTQAPAGR
jgi:predicted DNA-binding transcriptional regulator AlpA